jgi:O-antigen ligase
VRMGVAVHTLTYRGGSTARKIKSAAAWGFLGIVALAPLFFGGNVPLAWGINAALAGTVLIAYETGRMFSREPAVPLPETAYFPVIAFGAVCLWVYLQTVTWTPDEWHHALWQQAGQALGKELPGSISINRGETELGLLRLVTAGVCAWLGIQIGRDPLWAKRIVRAVAIIGAGYAVYGLALMSAGSKTVLWMDKSPRIDFPDHLTGPFINPNSFAAFAAMALICGLALLFRAIRRAFAGQTYSGWRGWLARAIGAGAPAGVYSLVLAPLFIGIILSQSRACFVLAALAAFVLLGIEHMRARLHGRDPWTLRQTLFVLTVTVLGGVAALATQGEGLGDKLTRFSSTDISFRLSIAGVTARAIADSPFSGFGYGTFADVFPLYRDDSLPAFDRVLEAHNAYLEAILGLGIPAAALLFAAIGFMVYRCFHGALTRRRAHLAPSAAAAATLVIGFHALVDFSIQLEGISMIYAALLGAGFAQSWRTPKIRQREHRFDTAPMRYLPAQGEMRR